MKPVFTITCGDQEFKVYADGRVEGFPDGAVINNYLPSILRFAVAGTLVGKDLSGLKDFGVSVDRL